ncbi:hypothetical protein [Leucobacter salsicius]|uniref:hypothetical protein n=1 Tax=Leucobacter salsicius TaxID=664638 RepID=UPI00036B2FA1|nr:hypothetical protein [Leucobacter salsicius]
MSDSSISSSRLNADAADVVGSVRDIGWWRALGLRTEDDPLLDVAALRGAVTEGTKVGFLAALRPVGFEYAESDGSVTRMTLEEVRERLAAIDRERAAAALQRREAGAVERLRLGGAKLDEAYAAPDAAVVIVEGAWAGFTRADATAWCWNLFQFEPHGFVHPGSQVRSEAMRLLEAGGLPEVFGYPARARELTATGLTPRSYRGHKVALGARTFTSADVMMS